MGGKIGKPCGTPGAVYGTDIKPSRITLTVSLPRPLLDGKDYREEKRLVLDLHDAILPVIEKLYSRKWELMAGQQIKDHDRIMPQTHHELFEPAEPKAAVLAEKSQS